MNIVSRSEWGAKPWTTQPATVPLSERTEYMTHYDGGTHVTRTGLAIPRAIESEHLGNKWSGIGYNFVVSQAGEVFEGRGWGLQGAHCPDHNRSAIGVQIAIGGDQEPTAEALAASRALYDEACQRVGRTLTKLGHKDGFATDCPGTKLYTWVHSGMPIASTGPGGATPPPAPAPQPPAEPTPQAFPGRYLAVTAPRIQGQDVHDWQSRMRQRGWDIDVDGLMRGSMYGYGPQCRRVCVDFQREKGLHQDGVVGPRTWAAAFRTDNVT